MNTMVGMQASLHTPTEDSLSDLMKSGDGDGNGAPGGAAHGGVAAIPLDLEAEDGDDFDPEELLKSPLFNDSAEKLVHDEISFGDFGGGSDGGGIGNGSSGNINPNQPERVKRDFVPMGLRRSDDSNFSAMKQQQQLSQAPMPPQQAVPYTGIDRDLLYGDLGNQPTFHNSAGMDNSITAQDSFNSHSGTMTQFNVFSGEGGGNQVMDDSSHAEFALDDGGNVNMMNNPYLANQSSSNSSSPNRLFGCSPERSSSYASSSYGSDGTPAPRGPGTAGLLDISQSSQMSCSNNGMEISGRSPNMFRRAAPARSRTYHPGHEGIAPNSLDMMKEQVEREIGMGLGGGVESNQLEMMQQHLLQMQVQEMDQLELQLQQQQTMDFSSTGMGRSMNIPVRSASCGPLIGFNNSHINGEDVPFHNRGNGYCNNDIGGGGVRIPSDLESMQNELSIAQFMNCSNGGNNNNVVSGGGGGGPLTVNDAMEKLCESMKRSAMSRTLVRQFSSGPRNVSRNNSAAAGMMMGVGRPNVRGVMDDNSHRSNEGRPAVPMRRISNTKHQLQGRGVHRHGSGHLSSVVNSMGSSNISLQIDGRNMGSL